MSLHYSLLLLPASLCAVMGVGQRGEEEEEHSRQGVPLVPSPTSGDGGSGMGTSVLGGFPFQIRCGSREPLSPWSALLP